MGRSTSGHDGTAAPLRSRRAMLAGGAAGALGMLAFDTFANTPQAQAASLTGGQFTSGFAPAVVTLSQSGGSVAVDASQGNVFTLKLTASGWTIANPANAVGDGQVIQIRLTQDAVGGRTVSWGNAYNWGSAAGTPNNPPILSTTPAGTDIVGFEYVAALSQWCYVGAAFPQNYPGPVPPPPISVVQSAYFPFNVEGNFANNVTPGNSIVLIPGLYTAATSGSFTTSNPQFGSRGNSVPGTQLVQGTGPIPSNGPGYGYTALWLLPDVAGGATYVRTDCTIPSPGGPLGMFAYEVAGLGAAPQLDPAGGLASAVGTATAVRSGSCPAITQASEIIFGFGHIYDVSLSAPTGGWTSIAGGGVQNFWAGYQIATTSGSTYSWSQTASSTGSWGAAVTAICPQPPAAPAVMQARLAERVRLRKLELENRKRWETITGRHR
jgi:hypothetical protein